MQHQELFRIMACGLNKRKRIPFSHFLLFMSKQLHTNARFGLSALDKSQINYITCHFTWSLLARYHSTRLRNQFLYWQIFLARKSHQLNSGEHFPHSYKDPKLSEAKAVQYEPTKDAKDSSECKSVIDGIGSCELQSDSQEHFASKPYKAGKLHNPLFSTLNWVIRCPQLVLCSVSNLLA